MTNGKFKIGEKVTLDPDAPYSKGQYHSKAKAWKILGDRTYTIERITYSDVYPNEQFLYLKESRSLYPWSSIRFKSPKLLSTREKNQQYLQRRDE